MIPVGLMCWMTSLPLSPYSRFCSDREPDCRAQDGNRIIARAAVGANDQSATGWRCSTKNRSERLGHYEPPSRVSQHAKSRKVTCNPVPSGLDTRASEVAGRILGANTGASDVASRVLTCKLGDRRPGKSSFDPRTRARVTSHVISSSYRPKESNRACRLIECQLKGNQ